MKPVTVMVNADVSGQSYTRAIRLDNLRGGFRLAVACKTSGSLGNGSFSVEYSFDDPNDLVNPTPVNQMTWLTDMSPIVDGIQGATGIIQVAPLYIRCRLTGTQGAVTMTCTQYRHGSAT